MRDVVYALAMPALMCASGIYAAGAAWWRRRRPAPPPYSQAGLRLAGERAVVVAEAIVADEFALCAGGIKFPDDRSAGGVRARDRRP
ncbi:hypothetical protein ABII15_09450 [Streptomyces sp. HUAS MG91]|uniref:Uncharacterized protein n=1 Tax=Streptomyces tabacisoli TaxID=3156398 RepID=A0AAU8IQJ3_9ACTN